MKTALWLMVLCSLAHAAPCRTGQTKNEAALIQIEKTWMQAVEQHDPAALGCILADEFEEADFAGSLIDRRAMLASATKRGEVHYELQEMHARLYGDVAYVRGLGVIKSGAGRSTVKSRFTDIFVYRDGRWQCVAGHESHFPQQTQ